ncbi:acyl-coenzyme A thioesterase 13-like [Limulus polyphemus]|uniref:Acyl-coenzyme A thioesterase 13-like n=1 Tax=Limulus polyphemus TaxID=6850 RepID=A0ABM1C373_LIMPO|nr:acyl-coenzyme A thioesterase 13-like [Limulus polyphemus]
MATASKLRLLKDVLKALTDGPGFDRVVSTLNVVSSGGGKCLCEMKVEENHQNRGGTLHGGVTATLVDVVSTLNLIGEKEVAGVSVDLNVTYLKGAKAGDELQVESSLLRAGRSMAFLSVDIRNKETGLLIAQGRHTKHLGAGIIEKSNSSTPQG